MKHKFLITTIFIFFIVNLQVSAAPLPYLTPKCPNEKELVATTAQDQAELLNALEAIVPEVYPEKVRKVETAAPLHKMQDSPYYGMAKNLCSEEIANNSWYIQLLFPDYLPSASASTGIMFVAKTKDKGWVVWHQYK
jgi:hypothetical protein